MSRAAHTEPGQIEKFGATSILEILGSILCTQVFLRRASNNPHVNSHEFVVEDTCSGRLDVYLAERLQDLSRSRIQKLISGGQVLVNSKRERAGFKARPGDRIEVTIPPPQPTDIAAEEIPLDILHEDDQIIVVNKPKGMTVHPAPGSKHGTLVNAILAHSKDLSGIGGVERPGIVHRLDKDTSGVLVVAKTDAAHSCLQKQIQKRTAERRYVVLVWGATKFNEAVVDAPIGRHPTDRQKMAVIKDSARYTARKALTNLTVLERLGHFTLIEAKLDTGRTHQIRVHCSFIGHPVVGDPTYGGLKRSVPGSLGKLREQELARLIDGLRGQALHAASLSFDHPTTHERMAFEAPIPPDMDALITWLRTWAGT